MLQYIRGYVKSIIPEQRTLIIELAGCSHNCEKCGNLRRLEPGQPLANKELKYILETFKKNVDSICFVGGENNQNELKDICKILHKEGLKTAMATAYSEQSMLNKSLVNELDYILYGRCDQPKKLTEKYFDPFEERYDWM